MFVFFTDWEFKGNVDNAVEGIKANRPEMQKYSVVNTRCTVTGENNLRTMTLWSSKELLDVNVDTIRAFATSASGMTPTSGMTGPLAVELE